MTTVKPGIARPPAVDKKLLSADDYETYQTFLRRWDRGPTLRELPEFAVVSAIFFVVYLGGFLAISPWINQEENGKVGFAFALAVAGLAPYVWSSRRSLWRWRLKLSTEARGFLYERIRDAPPRDREDGDDPANPYWATGNYDPRRYHAAFDGMNPEYRDYIRDAYGDLDTYESNRPD